VWGDTFDESYIRKFEQETGVNVTISYYASNEELLAKLRSTKGYGYDIVVPSDYTVAKLKDEGLIKKIDKTKLPFFDALNPVLLGHFFDPANDYSIPFEWGVYLIGINTNMIQRRDIIGNAWKFALDPENSAPMLSKIGIEQDDMRIAMVNDPVEVLAMGSLYLFDGMSRLNSEQIRSIEDLFIRQKPYVEAYTNIRSDYYLATDNCALAISQQAQIWEGMREYDNIDFVIPESRSFVTIEHCVIPVGSQKDDLVYAFLRFMYTKESFVHHYDAFASSPARRDVIDQLDATDEQKRVMRSSPEQFKNYYFIQDLVSEQEKHDFWLQLKS
jgi:spermidine/putrescine transport system substrate-binding protein